MDLRPIDSFFLQHDENTNICLQFLRQHILSLDSNISEAWKWELPFLSIKVRIAAIYGSTRSINNHISDS